MGCCQGKVGVSSLLAPSQATGSGGWALVVPGQDLGAGVGVGGMLVWAMEVAFGALLAVEVALLEVKVALPVPAWALVAMAGLVPARLLAVGVPHIASLLQVIMEVEVALFAGLQQPGVWSEVWKNR